MTADRTARPRAHRGANGDRFFMELRADHARFGRVLALIGRHAPALADRPKEGVLELLHEAVDYIVNFQHRYHHPREDRMFERISRRSPRHDAALSVLRSDHEQSFKTGRELLADLDRLRVEPGSRLPRRALVRRLQRFALDMREHIRREDELMYSSARSLLEAADWNAIARASPNPRDPLRAGRGRSGGRYRALARYVGEGDTEVLVGTGPEHPLASAVALGTNWTDHAIGCVRLINGQSLKAGRLALATWVAVIRPRSPAQWCAAVLGSLTGQCRAANRWAKEWRVRFGLDT